MRRVRVIAAAAAAILGCGPAAEDDMPGALSGELTVFVADHADGTSERRYVLALADGQPRALSFARDPGLTSGAALTVWGAPNAAGDLAVAGYRVRATGAATERHRGALLAGTPLPPRSFAFVLVDTGGGVNLTAAQATQQMFDAEYFAANKGSIRRYYREASYGLQDITGTVVGPIRYAPGSSCDPTGLLSMRAQVDAAIGARSDNYLWYFGSRQSGCAWTGLAALGTPAAPTLDTWFNASSSCVVLVQEPGHNFGMQHASSMRCGSRTFVDAPDDMCTHNEYGDAFDPMGSGCRHVSAWQKQYQGWLGGCNAVRVGASGTFTLLPLESSCDGIQVLQVPMPHLRAFTFSGGGNAPTTDELTSYFIELRAQSDGFDQSVAPQVQVRVGGDYRPRSQSGLHTWLLDMKPGTSTFADAAMAVGQTFTDPAGGVSFTATEVGPASATIAIEVPGGSGAPTCLDGTTLAPPGPATCAGTGAGGTSVAAGGSTGSGGTGGTTGVSGAGGTSSAAGTTASGGTTGAGGDGGAASTGGAPAADAGTPPGETEPGGCGCAAGGRDGSGIPALTIAFAVLISRRRRRTSLTLALPILAFAIVTASACADSEVTRTGIGGTTASAGTTGSAGKPGSAGTSGSAGAAGSAGADAGSVTWSCVEAQGALCFCNQGTGDPPRCTLPWTCCFAGPTSCECFDDDEAICLATIAMSATLRRVPTCPP